MMALFGYQVQGFKNSK